MTAVNVTLHQSGPSASLAAARQHLLRMDRPEAKGGSDDGMMGGEALLAGLGGCFMSNLLAAAAARGTPLEEVRIDVRGRLSDEAPARFAAIDLRVSAATAEQAGLAKLATIAERGCIVANTLRSCVQLTVTIG